MKRSIRATVAAPAAVLLVAAGCIGVLGALAQPAGASVTTETAFTDAWISGSITKIDLGSNITLTCTSGTPQRHSGTAITVDGHGHTLSQSCGNHGVLDQEGSGSVTFQNITVTGGDEGGIDSFGSVVVVNSTFTGLSSEGEGAAIQTETSDSGAVTVTGSAITDNHAAGSGGAIAAQGLITLTDSTVSGNTSGNNGGALRSYGGAAVVNSTISANTANSDGGAIDGSPTTLVYATVVGNSGNGAGNIFAEDGPLTSFGSVVAKPSVGKSCALVGTTTTHGYNVDDDGSCGFGAGPGDHSDLSTDLQLGPLAANGGIGLTLLPAKTSPLVDQIPTAACAGGMGITTDERGLGRPSDANGVNTIDPACDIGAVEVQAAVATTTTAANTTTTAAQPVTVAPNFTG